MKLDFDLYNIWWYNLDLIALYFFLISYMHYKKYVAGVNWFYPSIPSF